MMTEYAPNIQDISRLELRFVSVDCRGNLDGDDFIVGVPTVQERSTAHLTVSNIKISTTELEIAGEAVPAGKAILFTVDARGPSVKYQKVYSLQIEFDTDAGEHIAGGVRLRAI